MFKLCDDGLQILRILNQQHNNVHKKWKGLKTFWNNCICGCFWIKP